MKSWLDYISPELRRTLVDALVWAGFQEQAVLLFEYSDMTDTQTRLCKVSRQASHNRLTRIRSTAVMATVALSGEEKRFADAILSPDFAFLRPLSAEVHTKMAYFSYLFNLKDTSKYISLCDRAFVLFNTLTKELHKSDLRKTLQMQCIFHAVFYVFVPFGQSTTELWQVLFHYAKRSGALNNPYIRMWISLVGSYIGDCHAHLEWLLDEDNLPIEIGDVYCMVRKDTNDHLFKTQARLVRGEIFDSSECLYPKKPISTLCHLADYVLFCIRTPIHFYNESLILMVLIWIQHLREQIEILKHKNISKEEIGSLRNRLQKIERVQVMEKKRFFDVFDKLPSGPVKKKMEELWYG